MPPESENSVSGEEPAMAASSSSSSSKPAAASSSSGGKKSTRKRGKKKQKVAAPKEVTKFKAEEERVGYDVVLKGKLPAIQPEEGDTEDDLAIYAEEQEILFLLLHARKLMGCMLQRREEADRVAWEEKRAHELAEAKASGELSVQEIQNILQNEDFDEDGKDFVQEMQELKRQLVIEIRRNHVLDRDVAKLDKKIALLIKNRGNLQTLLQTKAAKKASSSTNTQKVEISSRQLANYQDLFYLLQTQPRYLARLVYLVNPEQMESFLDTTILTLYGDAYSPREEFLILKLFAMAIQHEISVIKAVGDFLTVDTVVPKMVITYNRRKAGFDYLKKTLRPPMERFLEKELNMELKPLMIYHQMINEAEIHTGERSTLERNVSPEKAMEHPEVNKIVTERLAVLRDVCNDFLQAIMRSQEELPYGLRWICKQLRELTLKALPNSTRDDIHKLTGYFVYYRFINVAIVSPYSKNRNQQIVTTEVTPVANRNLVEVSKVLQSLFNFRTFGDDQPHLKPLNPFIEENKAALADYFDSVAKVPDPEDALQVNTYMELTQKTKPVIQISLHELFAAHALINEHLDQVAPEKDDPLRKIMQDLGESPPDGTVGEGNNRDIQLTLTNRFKVDVEEDDPTEKLYAETKELLIPILRKVPIQESIQTLNLLDVLESGIKYAQVTSNSDLNVQINKILENINALEKEEMVTKDDNYESFVHEVAREVANRKAIREQQKKEIERLKLTLEKLRDHQKYLKDQITQYQDYLDDCKKSFYAPRGGTTSKANQVIGPFKFKYSELDKRGVIIDSEVPSISRRKTTFTLKSDTPGTFKITAKIAGVSVETMSLELDDLLEKHYNHITKLELDQVTLDVNMTIFLINSILKKSNKK